MSELLVTVYDRTNGEEQVGTYRAVAAPHVGDLVSMTIEVPGHMLRVEEVYWMVFPAHEERAVSHGTFVAGPLNRVTVFGRQTEGPHEV